MITVFTNLLLSLCAALVAYGLWKVIYIVIIGPYKSPLRDLSGPPNPSWISGNMLQILKADHSVLHEAWTEKYGPTIKYKGWLNRDRLYTLDTRALNHVLSHSMDYQKPWLARYSLGQILGEGLLVVEGEQHHQQRRIMNPAFGPAQIRELTEIFIEKAMQLRDVWSAKIAEHSAPMRIDVLNGLSKMTLDVIGLAGFNYHFDALNTEGKGNELNQAFEVLFRSLTGPSLIVTLKALFPPLRLIPDRRSSRMAAAQKVMKRIGMQLIAERKAEIAKAIQSGQKENDTGLQGRDLLTLLIKANMATDLPESQRLSDEDVLAQVPTFLVAGHETTSNATMWCLFALTQAPEVQEKLREELWNVPTDNPTMDELNELPYLDAVVRETMRVHAPVPNTIRIAVKEDVIPLNTPYADIHGELHDSIRVTKDTPIFIPILAINRSKALWGEDAFEFKPERWASIPEAVQNIPGVWGNMMSFLGGPRSCIGYRFSLVEMKALIFTLVRAFEFELAVPASDIIKKSAVVQRPLVRSEKEKGAQMPLLIKPYRRA
ncbi:cytochrome P450 [Laetiporus sulphureus 93-53]|uniref:Cytochrome P450 n=1 Tax=Laetiporus sulphureus 93-53 TaxID=1314785 RepID=A0A165DMU9_9APHY|nr:cytochrome P450 [Laetiporus sulphureus 93-53]KZT05226.1 cytochrome P450 [Laetiporus sulphureus 93-53]